MADIRGIYILLDGCGDAQADNPDLLAILSQVRIIKLEDLEHLDLQDSFSPRVLCPASSDIGPLICRMRDTVA